MNNSVNNSQPVRVTALTEVYGDGQKVAAAAIEYHEEIAASAVEIKYFEVFERSIISCYVTDSVDGEPQAQGKVVILWLDICDATASLPVMLGSGPHGRMALKEAMVLVAQVEVIKLISGIELKPFRQIKNDDVYNGVVDKFEVREFVFPENGETLDYNLYLPDHYDNGQTYPLVLFIHDAGSCSDEVTATLAQGLGAVVWARDEEQLKRPCFVVAPHYSSVCANDEFEVTWQADATIELIKNLVNELPVDTNRIYGTGQSMGCMMLCEMCLRHPTFFAACLLVAGQWNPLKMAAAKEQNLWIIVAEGDIKAFPIMGACMDAIELAGAKVVRGKVDAALDDFMISKELAALKEENCHLYFTYFYGRSILPPDAPDFPGGHHVYTWRKAYSISFLREWMFSNIRQIKED